MAGSVPARHLGGHLGKHLLAQSADQADALAQRDEAVRWDVPAYWVSPAHQGLCAHDAPAGHVHPRLVVHLQRLSVQRGAQVLLQLDACGHAFTHAAVVVGQTIATFVLHRVERQVGTAQQGLEVFAVARKQRGAQRCGHTHRGAGHGDGFRHALAYTLVDARDLGLNVVRGHQQEKFVAAKARHQVPTPHRVAQPCRHLHQQFVARAVTPGSR
jgi:hypothetical protein